MNDLAESYGLVSGKSGVVDTQKLRAKLHRYLPEKTVVYGHLLPYVVPPGSVSMVVVLRCEPGVLKERLRLRGYPPQKIVENVEAELIGVVSSDTFDTYGRAKTWEVDTTGASPIESASAVIEVAGPKPGGVQRIDWTLDYNSGTKLRLLLSTAG